MIMINYVAQPSTFDTPILLDSCPYSTHTKAHPCIKMLIRVYIPYLDSYTAKTSDLYTDATNLIFLSHAL